MSKIDLNNDIAAACKYITCSPQKKKIIMKHCYLKDESIQELMKNLISYLSMQDHEAGCGCKGIDTLDLSGNDVTDKGCEYVAQLLSANLSLSNLILSFNHNLTIEGF